MRKAFGPLDDALIERLFQPLADLASHRVGIGRVAVVCCLIDLAALSWVLSRGRGLAVATSGWHLISAFFILCFTLLGLLALIGLRSLLRRAKGMQANPLRSAMRPHRAIALLMLASELLQHRGSAFAAGADIAMLAFAASALYLGACVERPPPRRLWLAAATAR